MARTERTLDSKDEIWAKFDKITAALGHDEEEETLATLVNLGFAAITVTNQENRTVIMTGGKAEYVGEKCSNCGRQRTRGRKEVAVTIGVTE